MKFTKCDKRYVSEIDRFLTAFDQKNPQLSRSQQEEVKKYKKVFALRDNAKQK